MTDVVMTFPSVVMTFPSTDDDVKIAESIANHLKKPVIVTRPDGTKNYVIPCETGVFETKSPEVGDGELPEVGEVVEVGGELYRIVMEAGVRGPLDSDEDFTHPSFSEFGG